MAKRKDAKGAKGRKPPSRSPLSKKLHAMRITYQEGGVFQLKITLMGVTPPIWRRILVEDCTLEDLHFIIQSVMGWGNDHLYCFEDGKREYKGTDPMGMRGEAETSDVDLSEVARMVNSKFHYTYDFGDDWLHELLVEAYGPPEEGRTYPACIAGMRACPPEDVGGVWGYRNLVELLKDPERDESDERLEWLGEYDPEAFDVDAVNRALSRTCGPDSLSDEEEEEDEEEEDEDDEGESDSSIT